MKTNKMKMVLLFAAFIAAATLQAADAAGAVADPSTLGDPWMALIAAVTPFIIAGVKLFAPKIPTKAVPVIAGVLGLVIALAANYLAGIDVNWWQGLLLGVAGVGLRELYDQLKKPTKTVEQNDANPSIGQ